MTLHKFFIPIRLRSSANMSEHWTKKRKREFLQKHAVKHHLSQHAELLKSAPSIELVRLAPRSLDYDNLVYAFKHIRDCVSDIINPGLAPGQSDRRLTFTYSQRRNITYGISVEFNNGTNDPKSSVLTPTCSTGTS